MTWFKVDDSFYDHPKVFDAPDCAVALWIRAGTWSARNLTDGFVPAGMPARLCDAPETAVMALLDRGLWRRTKGGYLFHDWREYQPTKEEELAKREKKSSGGVLGNHRRWHVKEGRFDPRCEYCQDKQPSDNRSVPDRITDTGTDSHPNPPDPPRPDPISGLGSREGERSVTRAQEPPRKCVRHLNHADPPPCGQCGDARRANEQWHAAKRDRIDHAPRCATHPDQPAANCGSCRSERIAGDDYGRHAVAANVLRLPERSA